MTLFTMFFCILNYGLGLGLGLMYLFDPNDDPVRSKKQVLKKICIFLCTCILGLYGCLFVGVLAWAGRGIKNFIKLPHKYKGNNIEGDKQ